MAGHQLSPMPRDGVAASIKVSDFGAITVDEDVLSVFEEWIVLDGGV